MATITVDCEGALFSKDNNIGLWDARMFDVQSQKPSVGDTIVFTNYTVQEPYTPGDSILQCLYECQEDYWQIDLSTESGVLSPDLDEAISSHQLALNVLSVEGGDEVWYVTVELAEPEPEAKALGGNAISFLKEKIDEAVEGAGGLVTLSYGNSTWNDFIAAYNAGKIVYCRASSNSNPATGSQTRMAFMAYVSNPSAPTSVEFQYVRSVSNKSISAQVDQVFVYKLTNANGGTWTVETRDMASTVVAGTNMTSSYSNGVLTLNATGGGGGGLTTLYYDENDMKFYEDSQFTTVVPTVDVVNAIYDGVVFVKFRENGGYSQTKIVCAAYGPTTVTAANASQWKAATMDGSIYNPEPLFISNFADNTFQFGT